MMNNAEIKQEEQQEVIKRAATLDDLMQYKLGIEQEQADGYTLEMDGKLFYVTALSSEEKMELYGKILNARGGEDVDLGEFMLNSVEHGKKMLYMHCELFQQAAKGKELTEPWDIIDKVLPINKQANLCSQLYDKCGIYEMLNGEGKNG